MKTYNSLKTDVTFYKLEDEVCFEYENCIYKTNSKTLALLKDKLELPYKISFKGLSKFVVKKILLDIKDNNGKLFCYREKDYINDYIIYYAILTEKEKVKKYEGKL